MLTLKGATLLHVAAEYGQTQVIELLLDRGADVNAHAAIDDAVIGGQTAIFHPTMQFGQRVPIIQLLIERGANLPVRARLPGHYERPDEVVECTPLDYALLFPGHDGETVTLLKERGTPE